MLWQKGDLMHLRNAFYRTRHHLKRYPLNLFSQTTDYLYIMGTEGIFGT